MAETHHTVPAQPPKKRASRSVSNILAIIGFIILLIIIIWGLFHLAVLSSPWFAGIFNSDKNTSSIQVSAPSSVTSGNPTTVSWKYTPAKTGMYAFMYSCVDGLRLAAPAGNNTFNAIPCGAAFTTGSASTSLLILPINTAASSAKTTLTVIYIPSDGSPESKGTATMTVVPRAGEIATTTPPAATTTPTTTPSTPAPSQPAPSTPAPVVQRPVTPTDLAVTILSVSVDADGNAVATFDIANNGGTSSGTYYFTAQLPTQQGYSFVSQPQAPLSPGSHIVNTLRFNQIVPGGGQFSVVVDPSNMVRESTKSNNYASQYVPGPAYQQYPSGYPYAPYSY